MTMKIPTADEAVAEFRRSLRETMLAQFGEQVYVDGIISGEFGDLAACIEEQIRSHHAMLESLSDLAPVTLTQDQRDKLIEYMKNAGVAK